MMFKTIHECGVELLAKTEVVGREISADMLPVLAARASFDAFDKTGDDAEADLKLLQFLADHKHVSCFEHNYASFVVEAPLFIRSQIFRHYSFRFNEVSRRYTSERIEFWIADTWRKQAKRNKQCSEGELGGFLASVATDQYRNACIFANDLYSDMLNSGVCREQARAILPQSLLTRFVMTGNLRSWWSFLFARLKADAQYEVRVIAEKLHTQLRDIWPEAMNALIPAIKETA